MRRHRALLPYQPQPIRPTRRVLPLTISSASAPSADTATDADTVWRNRRRLMLKPEPDIGLKTVDFMCGSMDRAPERCNLWLTRTGAPQGRKGVGTGFPHFFQ